MMEASNNDNMLIYQSADGKIKIDVRFERETLWLSLGQMATLFGRDKSTISRHVKNVFEEGELSPEATVANFATVQAEGNRKRGCQKYRLLQPRCYHFCWLSGEVAAGYAVPHLGNTAAQRVYHQRFCTER